MFDLKLLQLHQQQAMQNQSISMQQKPHNKITDVLENRLNLLHDHCETGKLSLTSLLFHAVVSQAYHLIISIVLLVSYE